MKQRRAVPASRAPRRSKRQVRTAVAIKRVYDEARADDGMRVLVDRLWPRGIAKAKLKVDLWPKQLAPSTELRQWYGHDPDRFAEFRRRYLAELKTNRESLAELRAAVRGRTVTLLTATRDLALSHAQIFAEVFKRSRD